ncbi:MAG: undecaprenyl/decaprenyl-phosphate alpha-N-acetylglucosaminyl 1-phosphate transferase [candidate division Zixibacteria bacterium]|nr:undecaprenyl/decaprenyl-phosphate alpha-N-acetylglucosaminyl 1-phosphate transferase [candidate division Zixibacteria bacterium]
MEHYIFILFGSFIFSLILTYTVKKFCMRHNLLDYPNERKIHKNPTPRLGGVAIFLAFNLSLGMVLIHEGAILYSDFNYLLGFSLGGSVIFCLGVYDDLKSLKAIWKIIYQSLAILILILFGFRINILYIPFYKAISLGLVSFPITFLWCLVIINAFNLIDGLDGLAAGLSVIAAITLLGVGVFHNIKLVSLISLGMVGTCLGFLKYNYPPAKIFMGDSGSLYLGYVFAVEGVICPVKSYTTMAIFVPLLALGIPIFETFLSFFRRILNNKRFYHADKRHLFHFMLEKGFSQKLTIWIFYIISIILSITTWTVLARRHKLIFSYLLLGLGILILMLAYYLFTKGLNSKLNKK